MIYETNFILSLLLEFYPDLSTKVYTLKKCKTNSLIENYAIKNKILESAVACNHYYHVNKLLHNKKIPLHAQDNAIKIAMDKSYLKILYGLLYKYRYNMTTHRTYITDDMFIHLIKNNMYDDIKFMLEQNLVPILIKNYAVQLAGQYNKIEIMKLLLTYSDLDPNANEGCALQQACENGNIEIVKILLSDDRIDCSLHNNAPIVLACQNGNIEILKLLLKKLNVDPSVDNNRALAASCRNGYLEIAKILLADKRINLPSNCNKVLCTAINHFHVDIVELLLKDQRINPSLFSNSALYIAIMNNNIECVKLLLNDNRVDPSICSCMCEYNSINIAIKYGYLEIFKLLLKYVNINYNDYNDKLKIACFYGRSKIIEILLNSINN